MQSKIVSVSYLLALSMLSPREFEILDKVSEGHTAEEMSAILNISVQTVRTHVKNIKKKLELRGKRSLFHWCLENRPKDAESNSHSNR
jgi:DNA-binding CsgD family transcriptional regulator